MNESGYSAILDAIYDSATAFDRWPVALERVGEAFGCNYVGLIDRNLNTLEGRAAAIGIDHASQREFFNVWSKHDILRQRTPAYRAGAVETDQDILPRPDFLRSDYYNGFMKPRDMHAMLRLTLVVGPRYRKIISMSRPSSSGEYDTAHIEQCHRLMPHLQRAALMTQRVEESRLALDAFSDMLEQSATGVLLLDRNGRVAFANRAARAIAETADAFRLRRDRIEALNRSEDATLQRLIAAAANRTERLDTGRGGVMRLSRKSGKPELALALAPLPSGQFWADLAPVAFVLITDPEAVPARSNAMVRQLFGLTATEARVAERLMLGGSPEQAAVALNIKTSTARWHLASLYRKTGTSRQSQLVRLLLSVPTI